MYPGRRTCGGYASDCRLDERLRADVANPSFDVTRTIQATTLVIRGSLDINTAPILAEEIDKIVASKPPKVIADLSSLDLIDSSGVAALVKLYKALRPQ